MSELLPEYEKNKQKKTPTTNNQKQKPVQCQM